MVMVAVYDGLKMNNYDQQFLYVNDALDNDVEEDDKFLKL